MKTWPMVALVMLVACSFQPQPRAESSDAVLGARLGNLTCMDLVLDVSDPDGLGLSERDLKDELLAATNASLA